MPALLEVIAQSVEDAVEAEAGGADRIELVRSLPLGGLTPPRSLVQAVVDAVSIPVRVMLRAHPSMSVYDLEERNSLLSQASQLARLRVDGFVAGFLRAGAVDLDVMSQVAEAIDGKPLTFHRAFDELESQAEALEVFPQMPFVDRVLTAGQGTTFADRLASVLAWQSKSNAPTFLFALGLDDFPATCGLREVHVGRAARLPAHHHGRVHRLQVRKLWRQIHALQNADTAEG